MNKPNEIFLSFFRHVILGFTKNGRYLISYCLKIDNDDSSPLPSYVYSLHWWEFNQHRPLIQVGKTCIHCTLANGKNGFYKQFTLVNTVSFAFEGQGRSQSRTQSPQAFWSVGGRQERLWKIQKNLNF